MAGHKSTNLDAEVSKIFINADKAQGVDAFEVATLEIPATGRPGSDSPLKKTFVLEEGKGSASTRFVPTPRTEPKADDDQAEAQVLLVGTVRPTTPAQDAIRHEALSLSLTTAPRRARA